ncbi:uncharacterized protein L201_006675 [Kwoniella dendrophila CBS 6074]|uniref:Probable RNA-binding protein 18 n=1 Tax=Kwoniella dendrophila CBS 6074 TaxID=1295534 RepID=A0AAX4K3R6_9TREE
MQSAQPFASSSSSMASSSASISSANGKPDRLYVGNLSPTVDEYALIQIFSKYGKITKLDFMFHKSGVLKGKPRGFAFIQFSDKDDALKAMVKLHDRLLRGRKLVVTYASSAPPENLPIQTKGRRPTDPTKMTTLSLLKSSKKPQSASAQIAAMEAKLAHMKRIKPIDEDYVPGLGSGPSSRNSTPALEVNSIEGSPMPEDGTISGYDEVQMGDEEAEKAAEDLEKEIAELVDSDVNPPIPTILSDVADTPSRSTAPPTQTNAASQTLPPKPQSTEQSKLPIPSKPLTTEEQSKQRNESFKKGLAGLPKKPVF